MSTNELSIARIFFELAPERCPIIGTIPDILPDSQVTIFFFLSASGDHWIFSCSMFYLNRIELVQSLCALLVLMGIVMRQ